jgi:hypothetical protein
MSAPDIPTHYTFTLGGGLDVGLDDIRITNIPVITLDLGLDDIHIKELPAIDLNLGIKPTRVHLPSHYEMCFSVLGMEMFKVAFCGETMGITEPYVPRQTEKCA